MDADIDVDEYLQELRNRVCTHCIVRRAGAPPCHAIGMNCGIERHLPQLIQICRTINSALIDPYLESLATDICSHCDFQDSPACPCPLKYLLPLAVEAVEIVERHRRMFAADWSTGT